MKMGRKEFIKNSAMLGAAGILGHSNSGAASSGTGIKSGSGDSAHSDQAVKITFPQDGFVLNRHDGVEKADRLMIPVQGKTEGNGRVTVNGKAASVKDGLFSCQVPITEKRSTIMARSSAGEDEVQVWWNKGSRKRFRFSVDDNVQFLKDLALDPEKYSSLFDHWYLGFYRDMHKQFGTKVHLNCYYQTDGFDMTEMPEKWKDEWKDNASWLHLSFHALQDKPDRPYRNARYSQMAHDFDLVCGEIRRFAGNEVISSTTTVHWSECPKDGMMALKHRGIDRVATGFYGDRGLYLSSEQNAINDTRGAWYDKETGLMFVRFTMTINQHELKDIVPLLEKRTNTPETTDIVELMIHEQYFRKEDSHYQPDAKDKVRTAI